MATPFVVVFVTAPKKGADKLAKAIVKERLAACVNIVPGIKSAYWWKGKVIVDGESLMILKTRKLLNNKLIRFISKNHPYDVPEVISLPIEAGNAPYLKWLGQETTPSK